MLATNSTHNEVWQNCLDLIRQQTSQEEFAKWLLPINPLEFNGTILRICVPNASYVNEIEKKYMQMIRPIIAQVYGPQTRLYYAIPKQESSTATSADTTAYTFAAIESYENGGALVVPKKLPAIHGDPTVIF